MRIVVSQLPPIKGPDAWGGMTPHRAALLHPMAARSFVDLYEASDRAIEVTDCFRTPQGSLDAMRSKRGVQPPGYSAHNYGLAVDLTIDEILRSPKWDYERILNFMAAYGWHCHRRDHRRGSEDWHFNWLGPKADAYLSLYPTRGWDAPAEQRMQDIYGAEMKIPPSEIEERLSALGFRGTHVERVRAFQAKWGLVADGIAGPRTQRVLACVTAERVLKPIPDATK